jgi:hypothetical protein
MGGADAAADNRFWAAVVEALILQANVCGLLRLLNRNQLDCYWRIRANSWDQVDQNYTFAALASSSAHHYSSLDWKFGCSIDLPFFNIQLASTAQV